MKNNRRNLKKIWKFLDDACGALDNATINIADMENLPDSIKRESEKINIDEIVSLKNKIEILIEEKQKVDLKES